MELVIDGKKIIDKKTLFQQLKLQLNSQEFYGENLDALWDVLSYIDKEIKVTVINQNDLKQHLGEYTVLLLKLFNDVICINSNITVEIK